MIFFFFFFLFLNSGDQGSISLIIVLSSMETDMIQFSILNKWIYLFICVCDTGISISNKMMTMDFGSLFKLFHYYGCISKCLLLNGGMTPLLSLKFLINFSCLYQKKSHLCLRPLALVIRKVFMDQTSSVQILTYIFSFLDTF